MLLIILITFLVPNFHLLIWTATIIREILQLNHVKLSFL